MRSLSRKLARSTSLRHRLPHNFQSKTNMSYGISKPMLLLLDNYDSFTYNLAQYFGELGCELLIKRNDEVSIDEIIALAPRHICISPGPCTPCKAGISKDVVLRFVEKIPILALCLGHPCI